MDEKDMFAWKQGIMIKPGETVTIQLTEKRDNFKKTIIIENGNIIQKPDDIDILGVETPFDFEVRCIIRKN